jgi:hypothetical protein
MSTPTPISPLTWTIPQVPVRRLTVEEYHGMIAAGILKADERIELLEGLLVPKMTRHPPHDLTLGLLEDMLIPCLPAGWFHRGQSAITTADSEPEPDGAVCRGRRRDFDTRHPRAEDTGLAIEVADSSLEQDRTIKLRIYARSRIPIYWIVNIPERQIEVYSQPTGPTADPTYLHRQDYRPGDSVPLVLDGREVARIAVADLLP